MSPICSALRSSRTLTSFSAGTTISVTPPRFAASRPAPGPPPPHVAARRGPGNARRNARAPRALGPLPIGAVTPPAELLLDQRSGHLPHRSLLFPIPSRHLAADRADFPL